MIKKLLILTLFFMVPNYSLNSEEVKSSDPSAMNVQPINDSNKGSEEVVRQLRELIEKGDTAALHTLLALADSGDKGAAGAIYSLMMDSSKPGDLASRKILRELDATEAVQQAQKGSENAILVLLALDSYGNHAAKDALNKLDVSHFIDQAKEGSPKAFAMLQRLAFHNPAAVIAVTQLDTAKIASNIDLVKDDNASGRLMSLGMTSRSADLQAIIQKKYQEVDPRQLLIEANNGNFSAFSVLLSQCRKGDAAAKSEVLKYEPTKIIECTVHGDRACFFQLLELQSYGHPAAQKAFEDNDFTSLLIERINQADKKAIEQLKVLVSRKLANADSYMKIDKTHLVELANQGSIAAVLTLNLIYHDLDDKSVRTSFAQIHPDIFVEQVNQGRQGAIDCLTVLYHGLSFSDNSAIKKAFTAINPDRYFVAVKEGDPSALTSLRWLAVYGNEATLKGLTELAEGGDASAQRTLEDIKRDSAELLKRYKIQQ